VAFDLSAKELRISHFGQPFEEADVRGICGIAQSTKDITAIGRFGIGFKSVYAFTRRPEIQSGGEAFAIEDYVLPVGVPKSPREVGQTVIRLPLRADDKPAHKEITQGLENLRARPLLFLRHVREISWSVEGGPSGLFPRRPTAARQETCARSLSWGSDKASPMSRSAGLFSRERFSTRESRSVTPRSHMPFRQNSSAYSLVIYARSLTRRWSSSFPRCSRRMWAILSKAPIGRHRAPGLVAGELFVSRCRNPAPCPSLDQRNEVFGIGGKARPHKFPCHPQARHRSPSLALESQ
jgi:hypothetical protein